MDGTIVGVIVLFGGLLLWLLIIYLRSRTEEKEATVARQTFSYDSYTHCLTIKERTAELLNVVTIQEERNVIAKYRPDRIIYTGATVGGITTGGFHTEKGGYSLDFGEKTGYYYLSYKYAEDRITTNPNPGDSQYEPGIVAFVRLTTSDFEKAQQHPTIKRLIATEESKRKFDIRGDNVLNLIGLTKIDANYVLNWLSGR